jgi:hypothetical protein
MRCFLKLSDEELDKKLWGTPSFREEVMEHLPREIYGLWEKHLDKDF